VFVVYGAFAFDRGRRRRLHRRSGRVLPLATLRLGRGRVEETGQERRRVVELILDVKAWWKALPYFFTARAMVRLARQRAVQHTVVEVPAAPEAAISPTATSAGQGGGCTQGLLGSALRALLQEYHAGRVYHVRLDAFRVEKLRHLVHANDIMIGAPPDLHDSMPFVLV